MIEKASGRARKRARRWTLAWACGLGGWRRREGTSMEWVERCRRLRE